MGKNLSKLSMMPGPHATISTRLLNLRRPVRRLIIASADFILLAFAAWLAFSIRLGFLYVPPSWQYFLILMAPIPFIGVIALERFGIYRMVTRYMGESGIRRIILAVSLTVLIWGLIVALARVQGLFPRSAFMLFWLFAIALLIGTRHLLAVMINRYLWAGTNIISEQKNTVIYGAGSAGHQLARELKFSKNHRVVAFIDDDSTLWSQKVGNIKVRSPAKIEDLITNYDVKEILLALPSVSFARRHELLKFFERLPVNVKTIPSVGDITSGRMNVTDIQPVSVDDLLGRDLIPPDEKLLQRNIAGKAVLITGAGGSIGSELARQVLLLRPKTLVLFDVSEAALYEIELELRETLKRLTEQQGGNAAAPIACKVVAILGSVLDDQSVRSVLRMHDIATIYHAAAYKHVPIVELNPVAGLNNNVFGTQILVEAAKAHAVSHFILVSTDKAVRPTSVMGASKRLAELILQANAALPKTGMTFSMVRFGNVLASSGSVVRRFNQQIAQGGPVTVTHPKIIRYFMSIPEAAQLVVAAGSMAKGGDVFMLDMGEPVKILDLAKLMIRLSGMSVHDGISGDIAIEFTGLRPGEKLFEELLIGGETQATAHPRIVKSSEPFIAYDALQRELDELKQHMNAADIRSVHATLQDLVEGYKPDSHRPDVELLHAPKRRRSGRQAK